MDVARIDLLTTQEDSMPRPSPAPARPETRDLTVGERVRATSDFRDDRFRPSEGDAGTITNLSQLRPDDTGYLVAWDRQDAGEIRVDREEIAPFTTHDYVAELNDLRHQRSVLAGQNRIELVTRVVYVGESLLHTSGYLDQFHSSGRVAGFGDDADALYVQWDHIDTGISVRRTHLALEHAWTGQVAAVPQVNPLEGAEGSMSAGILDEARATIAGPRQAAYGSATDSFTDVGRHWAIILGVPVTAAQVAQALIALKLVRLGQSPTHRDSWVDIAGYSGLGAEAASEVEERGA